MFAPYVVTMARQPVTLVSTALSVASSLLPLIYDQEGNGIDFSRLPEGYRVAPLIALADAARRTDQAMAILSAADRGRIDQARAIRAAADRERIDQAMAIQAAADRERIDQARAIQAAADQTIAENAEVCLVSFYSY